MATNFAALAYKANLSGVVKRTDGAREADVINVKDYGAKGDGAFDDGTKIQAAFDAAFGAAGSQNADTNKTHNKAVYFPSGTYLTSQELILNEARGCTIFGNGQQQTIIQYTGAPPAVADGRHPWLLACKTVTYSHFEGITFDANGLANCAVGLMNYTGLSNDGTGNSWFDCGFIGGNRFASFMANANFNSNNLASEQQFVACTWKTGGSGLYISGNNALNYNFVSCRFDSNGLALNADAGCFNALVACHFVNNSTTIPNVYCKQQQSPAIVGGHFEDTSFCAISPAWVVGAYHTGAGNFWWSNNSTFSLDNASKPIVIDGCRADSSVMRGPGKLYMRGNSFGSGSLLTNFTGTISENI